MRTKQKNISIRYAAPDSHDALCHLREQLAARCLRKAHCSPFAGGVVRKSTRRSTWKRPPICKDLVTVLPLAHLRARHGTALMNNAWGHLPPLNYRSVEAQHMGTAQQVLMANSP